MSAIIDCSLFILTVCQQSLTVLCYVSNHWLFSVYTNGMSAIIDCSLFILTVCQQSLTVLCYTNGMSAIIDCSLFICQQSLTVFPHIADACMSFQLHVFVFTDLLLSCDKFVHGIFHSIPNRTWYGCYHSLLDFSTCMAHYLVAGEPLDSTC